MVDPISNRIYKTRFVFTNRNAFNSLKAIGFNKPHHFWFEAVHFMSHSVFKEQKCFNFGTTCFSGFSVEAADNLSNPLNESTAFFKKSFLSLPARNSRPPKATGLFQTRRAIVAIRFNRATLKFNFFYFYQRSKSNALCAGCFLLNNRRQCGRSVVNRGTDSSQNRFPRNRFFTLFSAPFTTC